MPNPVIFGIGVGALIVGAMLWRWAGRHSINFKGAAISSALSAVREGKMPGMTDEMKGHVDKISAAGSHGERAKIVGGTVARHFMAKFIRIAGLVSFLVGIGMMAAGLFWK